MGSLRVFSQHRRSCLTTLASTGPTFHSSDPHTLSSGQTCERCLTILEWRVQYSKIVPSPFSLQKGHANTLQQVYSIAYKVSSPIIILSTAYLLYSPLQTSSNIKYMSVLNNMLTLAYRQLKQTITNVSVKVKTNQCIDVTCHNVYLPTNLSYYY